ncbi:hypothetical protein E6O75_ATG02463 [Venturia nashicola]|uniref:Uncharacterized protein n=1 Tax=Venturia nashicola TaxID=86259 RepID=A0A4Z1P869_9PEZI|nr:hypothetical protein E6O75_ATG02463 [Venturia nashicola]
MTVDAVYLSRNSGRKIIAAKVGLIGCADVALLSSHTGSTSSIDVTSAAATATATAAAAAAAAALWQSEHFLPRSQPASPLHPSPVRLCGVSRPSAGRARGCC